MALEKQLIAQRLGQQISRQRARLRLTQEEAAAQVGVTHRAYQRWEAGESMPYPRNVEKVAAAFGVDVEDLLGEVAGTHPPDQLDRIVDLALICLTVWVTASVAFVYVVLRGEGEG